jgi:hypothetical protein
MREWRMKNKEYIREYNKKYKLENRERVLAVQRILNHKNYYANKVPKSKPEPKPKPEPEPKPLKSEPEPEPEIKVERGTFKVSF